jgi:6-phosphogluconolactonase (cycloisomerase 2 family)
MKYVLRGILINSLLLFLFAFTAFAQGSFVYTNNNLEGPNSISAFSVDAFGTLTEIPGSPFLTGGRASGSGAYSTNRIVIAGDLLFASNSFSFDISVFSIDPTTGNLTPVAGSPFPSGVLGGNGISLAVTPDQRFLFAGGTDSGDINSFSIGPNGSLTRVSSLTNIPFGGRILGMKTSPDGKYLSAAVTWGSGRSLHMFRIEPGGELTAVPGSPYAVGGMEPNSVIVPTSMDFSCTRNLLFAGQHSGATTTDVFNIDANGSLSLIPGSPFIQTTGQIIGNSSQIVLLSPNERFLFVSNQFSNTITVWNVAQNGGLTLVPGSSFLTGAREPAGMAINRAGTHLFVANAEIGAPGTISVLNVGSDGFLTSAPGSPFITRQGDGLRSIAAYPAKACQPAPDFDICIQYGNEILRVNSETADYQFTNCDGVTISGTGQLRAKGCTLTLQHNAPDRRIMAMINTCQNKATASVQVFSPRRTFNLVDSDITGSCECR